MMSRPSKILNPPIAPAATTALKNSRASCDV